MTTTIIEKASGTYTIESYGGESYVVSTTHKDIGSQSFQTMEEAEAWVEKTHKACRIMAIMEARSQNMEGYSYYGSNYGVAEDDYEEVAREIIEEFGI